MECRVEEAVPKPARERRPGDADPGLQPEEPSKEERVDICGLWLLKESSDAKSALQEKAFLETLSEVFKHSAAAAVEILAEAAPTHLFPISLILARGHINDDGTKQRICQELTKHEQIFHVHDNHGRTVHEARIFVELTIKAKESRRQLQDATLANDFARLRSSVPAEWQVLVANRGSVIYSDQRAAREFLSIHGSLQHPTTKRHRLGWTKCAVLLGTFEVRSRPEGGSFKQRSTSNSSMALRRCRRCA